MLAQFRPESNGGILVHCLSGWDRTPLFVSMIRVAAWAEGAAHASLNVDEMLYLTLAYDWMLFRHRLADRMSRREEVMFYCFYALLFLAMDDSVAIFVASRTPEMIEKRRENLMRIQSAFTNLWSKCIKGSL